MKFFKREINVFNMSALDLFASAMGAFIVVAVLLFPYYMKRSEAESQVQEQTRKLEEAKAAHAAASAAAEAAKQERETAEAKAKDSRDKLDKANATRDAKAREKAQIASALQGCEARKSALEVGDMDLVFAVDTTASMEGDIKALAAEMAGIVKVLEKIVNRLHVGVVAYRDTDMGDPSSYVTKANVLVPMDTAGLAQVTAFIRGLSTAGGASCAEAVEQGLDSAIAQAWNKGARRQIVVIGDAQAHRNNWQRAFAAAAGFAASPQPSRLSALYREHPTKFCPANPDDPRFFRELAIQGKGEYVDQSVTISESVLLTVLKKW
ncbi:MAG: hypothetical protein COW30_12960 [Rhodospirillales bacterium CG15_BIG_FIL_POST_REV_8_21_14_020_66_15]|nr:MAG: hypothetical protein COW30_12960 [Rhodospirillales bacterium CG15_BIG_FIL_POST_REV_8_21_14_020_66_15]